MVAQLKEDMPFYLTNDLMSHSFAKQIVQEFDISVCDLVPHINDLIEALGMHKIKDIHAPMSRDWTKFNEQTNWDDNVSSGPLFQMHKM